MGIRGVDIQVAIQSATEANKLQQADTAHGRAGEASSREEADKERVQKQKQSQQTEKTDQALIKSRKDNEGRDQDQSETDDDESEIAAGLDEVENYSKNKAEENRNKVERSGPKRKKGHLDILA